MFVALLVPPIPRQTNSRFGQWQSQTFAQRGSGLEASVPTNSVVDGQRSRPVGQQQQERACDRDVLHKHECPVRTTEVVVEEERGVQHESLKRQRHES